MRFLSLLPLAALLALPFITSCTALRAGTPVKAGYEAEEPSWAMRYIPGLKTVSDLIPPPTEARTKWDEWQKGRSSGGEPKADPW